MNGQPVKRIAESYLTGEQVLDLGVSNPEDPSPV